LLRALTFALLSASFASRPLRYNTLVVFVSQRRYTRQGRPPMTFKAPSGTYDLLPEQAYAFHRVRQIAFELFERYGYLPIETPTFEQLEVFVRGIGDATDVVGKEMYLALSQHSLNAVAQAGTPPGASDTLALRPEQTAGVARAVVQHNLVPPGGAAVKLVYAGAMFRHERPQKGRYREFRQIGVELLGAGEPSADA
jgi:histidyl-tRNA synthetase